MSDPPIYDPLLDGDPFLWEGGPAGVLLIHGYTLARPLLPGHNTQPEDANRYR